MAALKLSTRALLRRTDDIDRELKRQITAARAGDPDAALGLLQAYAAAVNDTRRDRGRQTVVRERLNRYIADAFQRIVTGTDANTALGLRRAWKRPRGTYATDHPKLANSVVAKILSGHQGSADKRYQQVADEAGVSKNTVKQAFKQFGQRAMFEAFERLSDVERTRLLAKACAASASKKSRK